MGNWGYTTQWNLPIQSTFIIFTFLSRWPTFPTSTYYFSLISMVFEDALADLPSLGQQKMRLPRRGPSRAGVRWILVGLPRRDRSDRLVLRRCKVRRRSPHVRVRLYIGTKSAPTKINYAKWQKADSTNACNKEKLAVHIGTTRWYPARCCKIF